MKIKQYDGTKKKNVLTAMVTSTPLLARVAPKWTSGMFDNAESNIVGKWCIDHFNKTGEAPGRHIEAIYREWAEDHPDNASVELIDKILVGLSESYDGQKVNVAALADSAINLFQKTRLKKHRDELDLMIDNNEIDKAVELASSFQPLNMGKRSRTHIHADEEKIARLFVKEDEGSLIQYPGDLGLFFGNTLCRGGFISFFGPEKSGKSFWLMDMATRAAEARHNVAYFEAGDMSEDDVNERFYTRALRKPFKACTVNIPESVELGDPARVTYKTREFPNMTLEEAKKGMRKYNESKTRSKGQFLAHSYHATGTLSVKDINSILKEWEQADGWIPDVVVIDYADILAPPIGIKDEREKINATWMELRATSLAKHCLVLTASQADAASYGLKNLTGKNFSNDKRKNAHATGIVSINATEEEQAMGLCRLGWLFRRKGRKTKQVTVATCLDLANPAYKSVW